MMQQRPHAKIATRPRSASSRRAGHAQTPTGSGLRRRLPEDRAVADNSDSVVPDERLFELVLRHFRDLGMTAGERRMLADALNRTIDRGGPVSVGPVGTPRRHYQLQRRVTGIHVRVGQAAVSLPEALARRLATALYCRDSLHLHAATGS